SSILSNGGAWNGRVLAVSRGFSLAGVTAASASAVGCSVAAGVPASGAWPLHAARARLMAPARTSGRSMGGLLHMALGPEAVQGSAGGPPHDRVIGSVEPARGGVAAPE